MSKETEGFADDFETGAKEDVVTSEAPATDKDKKPSKPVLMLKEEDCDSKEAHEAYLGYLTSIVPLQLKLDLAKDWNPKDVWAKMNPTEQKRSNGSFKKKGKFGGGGGVSAIPRTPAEETAFAITNKVRQSMLAHAENNFEDDLATLQGLNEKAGLSIEIYFKGWKKFKAGLPQG